MDFHTVGITCKSNLDETKLLSKVINYFLGKKVEVYIDHRIKKRLKKDLFKKVKMFQKGLKIDLLITLGGDGTMLRAVQEHLPRTKYFFGINMGHLGFLAEIPPEHFLKSCNCLLSDHCTIDERNLLKVTIHREGMKVKECFALNEIVVAQKGDVTRIIKLKTEVDRKKLATYHADGLIVSTPTGSTAYSLSVGGPIIHPKVQAVVISPINPHSFSQKPIVIPNTKTICIHTETSEKPLSITVDGQKRIDLKVGDVIRIRKHKKQVRFLRLIEESYFKTIRRKLGWGESNV